MNLPGENSAVLFDADRGQWLRFDRPRRVLVARTLDAVLPALAEAERQVTAHGLYAAGFVAYEAAPALDRALQVRPDEGFPLVWLGLYAEPQTFAFPPPPSEVPPIAWSPSLSEEQYQQAVERIRHYIAQGDTYQVNYSYRLRGSWNQEAWPFFVRLVHAQACGYGALVQTDEWLVACASPELFFRLDGRRLSSRPMKGTAARAVCQADDLAQAAWLRASEKNRAENVMIVDMVRNDMGRVAELGSVDVTRLFDVEKYPSLWQMTSTVEATTAAGLTDLLRAMFPAASITGAPKARTMQIIAEMETAPRRIYTGSIGFLAPNRRAQFNVAIRTVLVDRRRGEAEYGVGGGIVWDSRPHDEFEECRTKARVLTETPPPFDLLETLRWSPAEGLVLLADHLSRLADSAAYFSRSIDLGGIRRQLAQATQALAGGQFRIRLVVPAEGQPRAECRPLDPLPLPYRVRLARRPVRSSDPLLYHKTTRRTLYEQALAEAPGCHDVLLWNERGELTESTIANLAVGVDGRLLTPPVSCGLLPGIERRRLIADGTLEERIVRREDLRRGSQLCLFNSVRGMWQASLVET